MSLPILTLKGSPFELGYEHGKQAQKAIRSNFEFYLGFWHYWSGAGRERILQEAKKFIPSIEKADPDLMEELKGISRGAAMELEEIVALNSRYELGYAYMRASSAQKASEGCTAFALLSEASCERAYLCRPELGLPAGPPRFLYDPAPYAKPQAQHHHAY